MNGSHEGGLERSLGLREALAIGVGTMVGAGIFVFPGLAAGRAGPAAMASFAVGSAVALLVALPAAELATLSSANASILSSSRTVYALSRDRLLPGDLDRISERFRTPHLALLAAGAPIAALVLTGRVEVLAEVASLLHLVMYGFICFALIRLRRRSPPAYRPDFRCPGFPAVPLAGGVASFGLILFMQPLSILIGGVVIAAGAGWYLAYGAEIETGLAGPGPETTTDEETSR